MSQRSNLIVHAIIILSLVIPGLYVSYNISDHNFFAPDIAYAINSTQTISVVHENESYDESLLLQADKENYLGAYAPDDLRTLNNFPDMTLRDEVIEALDKMTVAARADGISLKVISAYRSYQRQQTLFAEYSRIYGEEAANTFSAKPGYSEHQLGTTIDLGNNDINDLTKTFETTQQGIWLAENAHHYGFVLSYPEGQEEITGYIYEPWHYRYIGVKHSYKFTTSGLTLNQYLDTLN